MNIQKPFGFRTYNLLSFGLRGDKISNCTGQLGNNNWACPADYIAPPLHTHKYSIWSGLQWPKHIYVCTYKKEYAHVCTYTSLSAAGRERSAAPQTQTLCVWHCILAFLGLLPSSILVTTEHTKEQNHPAMCWSSKTMYTWNLRTMFCAKIVLTVIIYK